MSHDAMRFKVGPSTILSLGFPRGGPTSESHLECHLVEYVLFYMVIMEHVMKKQNVVEENFQVVYLQNRKVLSCYLSSY